MHSQPGVKTRHVQKTRSILWSSAFTGRTSNATNHPQRMDLFCDFHFSRVSVGTNLAEGPTNRDLRRRMYGKNTQHLRLLLLITSRLTGCTCTEPGYNYRVDPVSRSRTVEQRAETLSSAVFAPPTFLRIHLLVARALSKEASPARCELWSLGTSRFAV